MNQLGKLVVISTHTHPHTRIMPTDSCEHPQTNLVTRAGLTGATYDVHVCTFCGKWATPLIDHSRRYNREPTTKELDERKRGVGTPAAGRTRTKKPYKPRNKKPS